LGCILSQKVQVFLQEKKVSGKEIILQEIVPMKGGGGDLGNVEEEKFSLTAGCKADLQTKGNVPLKKRKAREQSGGLF